MTINYIYGASADDSLDGTSGADTFVMGQGGADTVAGGDGDDVFVFKGALTADDRIDGGDGFDRVTINGDYTGTAALVFGPSTLLNIERISLADGHDYDVTTDDATVAAGQTLNINAGLLFTSGTLHFDGSAETDGSFRIVGGGFDDILTGGAQNDSFILYACGSDTVDGGAGDDIVRMGFMLDAADSIDGGSGNDTVVVLGIEGGDTISLGSDTFTNIERLSLQFSFYDITADDGTVAASAVLTVDATLSSGLVWDGSAETDGAYRFLDSWFDDTLTGGAMNDYFNAEGGGSDTINGGGGNDYIFMCGEMDPSDQIDGGSGIDTVALDEDYTGIYELDFGADTMKNVEILKLITGFDYDLVMDDGNVAAGETLTIDARTLKTTSLGFDGTAEQDGHYNVIGGAGDDTVDGGAQSDTFNMSRGGADFITGHGGGDDITLGNGTVAFYLGVSDSTGVNYDTLHHVNFGHSGTLAVIGAEAVTHINTAVVGGGLSLASFNADLAAAVGAGDLDTNAAVLFTADSGGLASHTFLIIDANNTAGYQADADYVIDVTGYTGSLDEFFFS